MGLKCRIPIPPEISPREGLSCASRVLPAMLLAAALVCVHVPRASAWESVLYDSSWTSPPTASFETGKLIQDFSYAGYRRGEQPLPSIAGPVFNAVSGYGADPTGTADSTVEIQNAIDAAAAAGGGVVYLPAGTYVVQPQGSNNFSLQITSSHIVIRGDGPGQTFICNDSFDMRAKVVVDVMGPSSANWRTPTATSTLITSDLMSPTRTIPVADASGFTVGDWVVVRGDVTTAWVNEHNEPDWLGFESQVGNFLYYRKLLGVDTVNDILTIDVPTRYYLKTRDNARVYLKPGILEEIGLEEFSIGNRQHPGATGWDTNDWDDPLKSAYQVHASRLLQFRRVRDSWVRNVDTYQPAGNTSTCHLLSNGVRLFQCHGLTLEDCHFQRPQYGGAGGNGGMFAITNSSECLLDDCISEFSRHGITITNMASSGNVLYRCRDKDTGMATGAAGSMATTGRSSDHHQKFSHSNLIDTCIADNSFWEAKYRPFGAPPLHNLTAAHSVFWNTEGLSSPAAHVVHSQQSRYGYVIGTRGAVTLVETGGLSTAKTDPVDHVEGAGIGDTLTPFSLFEDQRLVRLELPAVDAGNDIHLLAPENSASLAAAVTFGGVPNPAIPATIAWSVDAGPGAVSFSAPAQSATFATFSQPGVYVLRIEVTKDFTVAFDTIAVHVHPFSEGLVSLLPEADSYAWNGAATAGTNYGISANLSMKNVGNTSVEREIYMRYDLAAIQNSTMLSAILELHAQQPDIECNARTRFVSDDSWGELTINWNNKPNATTVIADWSPDSSLTTWIDLTARVQTESDGDGKLSLRHQVLSQVSTGTVFSFGSKERADDTQRPYLTVHYQENVDSFAAWIAGYPSVPTGERGAADDPDNDGSTNIEEMVHATDPGADSSTPGIALEEDGTGFFLSFVQRNTLPPEIFYFIETSSDLQSGTWEPVPGVVFETAQDLGSALLLRARVPDPTGNARIFYRLRYVLLP